MASLKVVCFFLVSIVLFQSTLSGDDNMDERPEGPLGVVEVGLKNLEVGTAENEQGPTGVTVINFPRGAIGVVDQRGGAVAMREGSALSPDNTWGWLDALVFTGGSTFGLASADGVMSKILESRGGNVTFNNIPAVPAAVVYDFSKRDNSVYPDAALGAKAFEARKSGVISYGRVGAGRNVSVGKWFNDLESEPSGQGVAYYEKDGVQVLVLTIVNAVGNVTDSRGEVVRGSVDAQGNRTPVGKRVGEKLFSQPSDEGNTTLTAVITNVRFDRPELQRLASMAHTSMNRVIHPFQTPWDGDVLFAISTREMAKPRDLTAANIGVIAADLLQTAVWRAVDHKEE